MAFPPGSGRTDRQIRPAATCLYITVTIAILFNGQQPGAGRPKHEN